MKQKKEKEKFEVEKVFGKEKNKGYKIRRNIFFIGIFILIVVVWLFLRYSGSIDLIREIPKYISIVNLVSIFGLIVVLAGFYTADRVFKINFKKRHYFFIVLVSIFGILFSFFYFEYPNYDKLQHLFFPMMYASMIYHMISKLKLPKKYSLLFTFFIVIGLLSMFELLEYFLDFLFDWKLQGVYLRDLFNLEEFIVVLSRIDDTMIDVLFGVIGTLTYVLSIFFFFKENK